MQSGGWNQYNGDESNHSALNRYEVKGGVSKTTTVVNLGAARGRCRQAGDCDPQSHLAQHLGIPQSDIEEGLEDVLKHKRPDIREIALETSTPKSRQFKIRGGSKRPPKKVVGYKLSEKLTTSTRLTSLFCVGA